MKYLVYYASGTGGHFIRSIVSQLITSSDFLMNRFDRGSPVDTIYHRNVNVCNMHEAPKLGFIEKSSDLKIILITIDPSMYGRQSLYMYYKNMPVEKQTLSQDKIIDIYLSKSHESSYIYPYNEADILPDSVTDKFCKIRMQDIFHDMDKVLNQLSELTAKPIVENTRQSYINYLNAQRELIPWYNDSPKK